MKLSVLCYLALNILSVLCYMGYYESCSYTYLCVGVVLALSALVLGISGSSEAGRLFSVIIFLFSLRVLIMLRTPSWGFSLASDSSYGLKLSESISVAGKWSPGIPAELADYSSFPALHLWTVILSEISGINMVIIAQFILPVISGALIIIFLYIGLKSSGINMQVSIMAAFIFCLNTMFMFFDEGYTHETFALIFYAMYIMVFLKIAFKMHSDRRFILVGLIACFSTIFSHHWSGYNLIIFSIFSLVFPFFYARMYRLITTRSIDVKAKQLAKFTFATCAIVFSWIGLFGLSTLRMHILNLITPLTAFALTVPIMSGYTSIETIVVIVGTFILMGIGIGEFVLHLLRRETKSYHGVFFDSWFVFSAFYILIFTYLSPTQLRSLDISKRCWTFAYFGLAPLIAMGTVRITNNLRKTLTSGIVFKKFIPSIVVVLVFILPIFSCLFTGATYIHDPAYPLPGDSYYQVSLWMKDNVGDKSVVVDRYIETVLVPYGNIVNHMNPVSTSLQSLNQSDNPDEILYQSNNVAYLIPEREVRSIGWNPQIMVVLNSQITKIYDSYPNVKVNSSALDQSWNRILDSPPLAIYEN